MKKILLLSDTHGYIDDSICKHAEKADEIWHAGDIGTIEVYDKLASIKPIRAVYGNIDGEKIRKVCPKNQRFLCERKDVWITHIGGYPPNYTPSLKVALLQKPPHIFICGHSHILKVIYDKNLNILHLNPGAAGHEGFHKVRTMLRFVIDGDNIKDMDIIELGARGTVE
ncbi:MAG TPA: metallophosphoesterase family protein [Bacteroidia bacterium]|nr:metallophosphoesterase family protein [Bacteroidia bacterium]